MKKNQIRKSVAALAMADVVSVSLLGYGCGSKPASSTAGVSDRKSTRLNSSHPSSSRMPSSA